MTITIRFITDADIDGFHAALDALCRERKYLTFLEAPPLEHTRTFVRDIIAKGYPQLVVLDGELIVGWCDIMPPGRAVMAHVGTLGMGLLPAYRDRGLGRQVMVATLAAADAFGFTRIELGVYSHNQRARALYRSLGFVEEGVRRRRILIDGIFHDEIMMARVAT